jgi:hypothetical protein
MLEFIKKYQYIIYVLIIEILLFIIEPFVINYIKDFVLFLIIGFSIFFFLLLKKKKINNKQLIVYLIIIVGFIIRYYYVVSTKYGMGHDVTGKEGHLHYIQTIFETGKLPNTNEWQFYHPPLWHYICAFVLKVNDLFNVDILRSYEGLQYVSLFVSFLIMVVQYKIIDKLKVNDNNKFIMLIFFVFYSHYIYLAGSINNDILLVLFEYLIIYFLIEWNELDNYENTILLALVTGCAVMTKLNGAIMAIPILFIFIRKFLYYIKNNKEKIKTFIIKMLVFGLISLPIGLWYQARNYVKFDQQLGFVPKPGSTLYVGDKSIVDRFIKINMTELFEIECKPSRDYSLPTYLFKSSIFGEYMSKHITTVHLGLLLLNIVLIVISIIAVIKYFITKKKDIIDWLLLIIWIASIGSFIYFNIKYPYGCTMDFRYILLTVFCFGTIFIKEVDTWHINIRRIVYLGLLLFSALSVAVIFIK